MAITKTGVINDLHLIPGSPTPPVDLVLDAFEDIGLDRIVLNGDLLDFINVNMWGPKHPDVICTLQDEIICGREFLEKLRKRFPKIPIIFLFGNHEDRLDRFILKNSKPFWDVLRLEKMLTLEELDIEWYEYNYEYQLEKTNLYIQHSPPSYGVNGARTSLLMKLDRNFIYACSHREQHAAITGASGNTYRCWFNGWLGSTTMNRQHEKVFGYCKGHTNWQRCAGVAYTIDETEFFYNQFEIKEVVKDEKYQLLLEGAIYET